ncbi:hypothetical protein EX895_000932 [Sporisorium graminicola]|uniref:C2H2-type domain-containing protein n=1 Tax=Sporisorium graminicola TaxID=280036 RepID=A0A4U7L122_9BASI|nr:hypothetical protein EX895_000932 [Sporisorium graminicola]TKY90934.1 hypothetical protein EX895_000932 [Sporisorium graminicola]
MLQYGAEAYQTQTLHNLDVPFGTDLAASLAPPFDPRSLNAHFYDAAADGPVPVCPSSINGCFGLSRPTDSIHRGEEWNSMDPFGSTVVECYGAVVHPHGQEFQRHATARQLLPAEPLATAPAGTPFSPNTGEYGGHGSGPYGQACSQRTVSCLQDQEDTLRLQFVDVSMHHEAHERQALSDPASNPTWGFSRDRPLPLFGIESRDLFTNGGHDSLATSGTTSALGLSRSLPGSTLTSNDAWLSRSEEESLPGPAFLVGGRASASASAQDTHQRSVPFESSFGPAGNLGFFGEGLKSSSSNEVAGANLGGGRIEEGCIGSKKRVWYRAPNGQFASATQALSGQHTMDSHGNDEQSSQSSSVGIRRIRRRRKSEDVERKYRCDYDGCDKAYGTLNHLNTHRATNEHGPRLNAVGYRRAFAEWERRQTAAQRS